MDFNFLTIGYLITSFKGPIKIQTIILTAIKALLDHRLVGHHKAISSPPLHLEFYFLFF